MKEMKKDTLIGVNITVRDVRAGSGGSIEDGNSYDGLASDGGNIYIIYVSANNPNVSVANGFVCLFLFFYLIIHINTSLVP